MRNREPVMPQDLAAERALLGAILLAGDVPLSIDPGIGADLHLDAHRKLFAAYVAMQDAGTAIDTVTLEGELRRRKHLEAVGGISYVASLIDGVPAGLALEPYQRSIQETAKLRRLIHLADMMKGRALDPAADAQGLADEFAISLALVDVPTDKRIRDMEDVPDVLTLPRTPVQWAVSNLIPLAGVSMLAGLPGTGKSFLALALARAVLTGGEYLGRAVRQFKTVLYLDAENPLQLAQDRTERLFGGPMAGLKVWGLWNPDAPALIGDPRLLRWAEERPLIVIDSLIRFHAADENSASEMRLVMAEIRKLAAAGATVLLLHHSGKVQDTRAAGSRGSTDILAAVDMAAELIRDEEGALTLKVRKNRMGPEDRIEIVADFQAGRFTALESAVMRVSDADRLLGVISRNPGATTNAIVEAAGMQKARAGRVLRANIGKLWDVKSDGKTARYHPIGSKVGLAGSRIGSDCMEPPEP